jgi:peptidoglycan pentaglycine glycine transferase (the first glycine)
MRPKCRYNLRIAERHGVQIESSTSMDRVHEFHELLTKTAERDGFFAEPLGFFISLCGTLFRVGTGEFLTAKYQGETLAMILVVNFGTRSTYLYGASSDLHRNVMPTYLLHWSAIQSARSRGAKEYDFYGIDALGRRVHLYAGITRFKRQWGGSVRRRIGARDYIFYDRLADAMVGGLATTGL